MANKIKYQPGDLRFTVVEGVIDVTPVVILSIDRTGEGIWKIAVGPEYIQCNSKTARAFMRSCVRTKKAAAKRLLPILEAKIEELKAVIDEKDKA